MVGHEGITRRAALGGMGGLGGAALLALAGCAPAQRPTAWIAPTDTPVRTAEAARHTSGATRTVSLTAAPAEVDFAGKTAKTWTFGSLPAPVIRANVGDTIQAMLTNHLPEETTVHWHGVALRNDMDGVPHLTQDAVPAGGTFRYDFTVAHPGTYWFHPHVGTQLDRGLYGALLVDDPADPGAYDQEWVIILDDWLDGVTTTPGDVMTELRRGMGDMGDMHHGMAMKMGNLLMGATSTALGGDAGDVYYPLYLINGKPDADPAQFTGTPGQRVRLRIINAGSDTVFRVGITDHTMTVTHTDGFPVQPVEGDNVLIGMGERYDVTVTLGSGAFALIAAAEGKDARTHAVIRTGAGTPPSADANLPMKRTLTAAGLQAKAPVALAAKSVDRNLTIRLTGGMAKYDWSFDNRPLDPNKPMANPYGIASGERVRITWQNNTTMAHPLHLHGHTPQIDGGGPRKDTALVLPGKELVQVFDADNPGRWLAHCHNLYHGEAGMMATIAYQA